MDGMLARRRQEAERVAKDEADRLQKQQKERQEGPRVAAEKLVALRAGLLTSLQAYKGYVYESEHKSFLTSFELRIEDKYLLVLSLSEMILTIGTYPNQGQFDSGSTYKLGDGIDGMVNYTLSFSGSGWIWRKSEVGEAVRRTLPFPAHIPSSFKGPQGLVLDDAQMSDYVLRTIVLLMQLPRL